MKHRYRKSNYSQSKEKSVPTRTPASKRKCNNPTTNGDLSKISKIDQAPTTQSSPELCRPNSPCESSNEESSVIIRDVDINEILKTPPRARKDKTLDEVLVLADSYPNFFHFEKGPRTVHYTLIFHGERYNSALYTRHHTYWQCYHRRKYRCKARICATNDYKHFERRHTHTHGKLPEKTGTVFTPQEALPEIFEVCRNFIKKVSCIAFRKKNLTQMRQHFRKT